MDAETRAVAKALKPLRDREDISEAFRHALVGRGSRGFYDAFGTAGYAVFDMKFVHSGTDIHAICTPA